jgi:hypothetical protein
MHGNAVTSGVVQKHFCFTRFPILYAFCKGAAVFAQFSSIFAHMIQKVFTAGMTHHNFRAVPCNSLCPLAPKCNYTVCVNKIYAVIEVIEYFLVKFFVQHFDLIAESPGAISRFPLEKASMIFHHLLY